MSDPVAGEREFLLPYGGPFNVGQTLAYLGRDPDNRAERVEGKVYRRFFPLGGNQVPVALTLEESVCRVQVDAPLTAEERLVLQGRLRRFLGLEQPLAAFYRAVRNDAVMAPLTKRYRGVRIPQVPSLWEALCWAVIGQQINLAFAYRLRNRFIALGNGLGDDLSIGPAGPVSAGGERGDPGPPLPFPDPEGVLAIPAAAWRPAQFSRQKTAYLQGLAAAFANGEISETALEEAPLEAAEATLRALRGLGPWSVAYGLLRALGRMDALPVGDAGLRAALRHHFGLTAMPDAPRQQALMEPYRPYRGLATTYFWKSLEHLRQE